jgi:HSP20 family protein
MHMANIKRYDPLSEIVRFDPFLDMTDLFPASRLRSLFREMPAEPEIRMDVSEDDKAYYVKADIPGVSKEDIHVDIDGNRVSVTAEVKKEKEEKKGATVLRSERYYGQQSRAFTLRHEVDQAKAEAKYKEGVLELTLPKKGAAEAKHVTVQ